MLFTEPAVTLLQMLVTHYPALDFTAKPHSQTDSDSDTTDEHVEVEMEVHSETVSTPGNSQELALIIPCHNSAKFIAKTIKAALLHFKPQQIFIMDNGRASSPTDNTEEVVKSIALPLTTLIWPILAIKPLPYFMAPNMPKLTINMH